MPASPRKTVRLATMALAKRRPEYARYLNAQLLSLVGHPARASLLVDVWFADDDRDVIRVIEHFRGRQAWFSLQDVAVPERVLNATAFVRHHIVSTGLLPDVVWLADARTQFGPGSIDFVAEHARHPRLYYPSISPNGPRSGFQILQGKLARRLGYLPNTHYQRPRKTVGGQSDIAWLVKHKFDTEALDIPGLSVAGPGA